MNRLGMLLVRRLANRLADGEFERIISECSASRLSASELQQVMEDYGKTFVRPPSDAYGKLDAIEVQSAARPTWSVRAPLWSREEGRSDLTLEVTIIHDQGVWKVELDDLRVP